MLRWHYLGDFRRPRPISKEIHLDHDHDAPLQGREGWSAIEERSEAAKEALAMLDDLPDLDYVLIDDWLFKRRAAPGE